MADEDKPAKEPAEGEAAAPAEGEAAAPAEGEAAAPAEGEAPAPAEGEAPAPAEGEKPAEDKAPAEGEAAAPAEGEAAEPAEGETPVEAKPPEEGEAPAEAKAPAEGEASTEAPAPAEEKAVQADKTVADDEKTKKGDFSITKIHVRPSKPFNISGDLTLNQHYLTSLPVISDDPKKYVPMPYTFRVPSPKNTKIETLQAKCPPYHLQLDHTIAVIWLLFSETDYGCQLGIAQLQWALTFLKTIYNRQGDHPKDIQLCIETIEDLLMEEYADLSNEMTKMTTIDETQHYIDGVFGSEAVVTKDIPFSINYVEMTQNNPLQTVTLFEADKKPSMTEEQITEELENIKKAAGVDSMENLDSVSKTKAINFLNIWKSEQVEKIKAELKRLRSIEDMMKNIDEENFQGYLEENNMEVLYSKN